MTAVLPIALKLLRSPWLYIGLLVVAVGWYRHDAIRWHVAYNAQRQAYIAAGEAATARQIAANLAVEARYSALKDKTDAEYHSALDVALRRTADYSAAHRVRPGNQGAPSGPDTAAEDNAASGGDGPGSASVLVAVIADDIAICSANTARLDAVRAWGQQLQADGLAQ